MKKTKRNWWKVITIILMIIVITVVALKGIGYLSNASMPAVIINMMRGGPGLGTIQPGQADYNMTVKGGSNGDYHDIVLAPASVPGVNPILPTAFPLTSIQKS